MTLGNSRKDWGEYLLLRAVVALLGMPPRGLARAIGDVVGLCAYHLSRRLRSVAEQNLSMALPHTTPTERQAIVRGSFRNLGIQIAEFCRMRRYHASGASEFIRYEGFENYRQALNRGKGVFVITAHLGAWELSSFYHSLMGNPMDMVIRRLDNRLIDTFVNGIRCLHGNRVLHKDDFARGLIASVRAGRAVGVLMDTNMTPPQGVFVPFFGILACTASGVARVARKTGAAVLPGFLLWEKAERQFVLHFGEEIRVDETPDAESDALTNTARFTAVLERYIGAYPDQWLWMHRRWKTRPAGEPALYTP